MNEERVYEYIRAKIDERFVGELAGERKVSGVSTQEVAEHFEVFRSNASALLNLLVKKGKLCKIESRPVYYLPTDVLASYLSREIPPAFTTEEFFQALCPESPVLPVDENPFDLLIGSRFSLTDQVEQAKAAILYPPRGLHTLIIGESGTGKTLFARTMHEYGLKALHREAKNYSYVEFNCADYYHNPQLLMSHLFGHIKGAFTGANEEKVGIVEKADGGILFLDEIHRLPPEGQELLFYLMDKGQYRKLGESDASRRAEVLIIAATTEEPSAVLLKTFMRRIPLTINMPSFRNKPVEEKIRLIEHIFKRESTATRKTMVIAAEVIKALAGFDFPGNIGQLNSEIKVLCARTFLNADPSGEELRIELEHLSKSIRENYRASPQEYKALLGHYHSDILVTPSNNVQYLHSGLFNEKSYRSLLKSIDDFISRGVSKEEMNVALADQIRDYYNNILEKFQNYEINREEIYKVVDKDVVDFTIAVMQDVTPELDIKMSQRSILVMAFHIKYLLERIKSSKTISRTEINHIEQEYAREMQVAQNIVQRIQRHFDIDIPKNEKYFLAILLANVNTDYRHDRPALFVVAHGKSTASSIASVCNQLMACDMVRAVDAPLEQSVHDTYRQLRHQIMRMNPVKGVILMVDMGSLIGFGERLTNETGIPTRTVPNVTTLMALDLTRIILSKENDLDRICSSWDQTRRFVPPSPKPYALLTTCASGLGTSEAFKVLLEDELEKAGLTDIAVLALSFEDVKDKTPLYQAAREKYEILVCVGTIAHETDMPFVHISKLISPKDRDIFIKYVAGMSSSPREIPKAETETVEERCCRFLKKSVTFVNPDPAVRHALDYLHALALPKVDENEDLQVALVLHLGFMLERLICGKKVVFDDEAAFLAEHRELHQLLREHAPIIERGFDVSIHDGELCYIMQTINKP